MKTTNGIKTSYNVQAAVDTEHYLTFRPGKENQFSIIINRSSWYRRGGTQEVRTRP